MKWNQFRLKTTTEAEDIVSSMLADLGIEGVQIEDILSGRRCRQTGDVTESQTGIGRNEKLPECRGVYD